MFSTRSGTFFFWHPVALVNRNTVAEYEFAPQESGLRFGAEERCYRLDSLALIGTFGCSGHAMPESRTPNKPWHYWWANQKASEAGSQPQLGRCSS